MAISRYKHYETVWNNDIQHTQKGFMNLSLKNTIQNIEYGLYEIPLAEQYRPDLIAKKFYGDGKLFWILIIANDINDSPEGFEKQVIIKIPNPNILNFI